MNHKFTISTLLVLVLLLTLPPTILASTTWYVNGVSGNNSNNCLSPSTACKTIGHTISLASSGDTVMVAPATYTERPTIGVSLKIVGSDATTTIVDGGHAGTVFTISSATANVTLSNFTIRNGSGHYYGGGVNNEGKLTINDSTISGSSAVVGGGGISSGGSISLQNSIVANSPHGGNCNGDTVSNGYNLSSDNTCNFNGPGDMNNTSPILGTFGNYGGPTQTVPLLPGSPAIDAGNPSGCTDGNGHLLKTDQRGYPRPDKEDKTGCDMGAYESQSD